MQADKDSRIHPYGDAVRAHLEFVERENASVLDKVAERVLGTVTSGHRILVGGSGHSLALMLEGFYRAGGLACVTPLFHPGLLPLHGAAESTLIEHMDGLAELLVARANPGPEDIGVVVSHSGANAVPIELARELHARRTPVVAFTSSVHAREISHLYGHRLIDLADFVLDTAVPYGDAAYPAGSATTAGMSSMVNVFLWNQILVRVADRAVATEVDLPLWTSSNVEGGQHRNQLLRERYALKVQAL